MPRPTDKDEIKKLQMYRQDWLKTKASQRHAQQEVGHTFTRVRMFLVTLKMIIQTRARSR